MLFSNCVFTANWGARGGGVSALGATVTSLDSVFTANVSRYSGAGIYCQDTLGTFDRCSFKGNSAGGNGGGYGADNVNPSIRFRDCLFSGNRSANGGGLRFGGGSNELVNCTVAGNYANETSGGIHAADGNTILRNSIVWHNGIRRQWSSDLGRLDL